MISDYIKFGIKNIMHTGVRSWLTMMGVFIGITAVVSLISIGQGLQDAMKESFERMGSDIIMVMPGAGMMGSSVGASASQITEEDKKLVEKTRGVDLAGGMTTKVAKVVFKGDIEYTFAIGIPTDRSMKIIEDMQSVRIHAGRKFRSTDRYVVILGSRIAEGLFFEKPVGIGETLELNGKDFKVIGTLEPIGTQSDDEQMYIPLDTSLELFDVKDYVMLLVKPKAGYVPSEVADWIKKDLRRSRGLKKGEEDFTVQTSEDMLESIGVVLDAAQIFFVGIASISLIVGGIGIMNTMYTSVLERTKEIGIMKAIGARNTDIMMVFLVEAGLLGLVGGIIGSAIGILLSKSVEFLAEGAGWGAAMKAHVSFELVFGALAFSFVVGCLSGVLPARQAAKLKPVETLRYE